MSQDERPPRASDAHIIQIAEKVGKLTAAEESAQRSREILRGEVVALNNNVAALVSSVNQLTAGLTVQNGVVADINLKVANHESRISHQEGIEKKRFVRQTTINGVMLGAGMGIARAGEAWDWIKGFLQVGGKG